MRGLLTVACVLFSQAIPGPAHRLDEYLQGTLLTVEKNRVQAQMTLTPGVAVLPAVLAQIDTNSDGAISKGEQRAYAARVLADLSLRIDGRILSPQLLSVQFPEVEDMKEGRGEIRLEFAASLPGGGPRRTLTLVNRHLERIAAYQVNCLVPTDPGIRVLVQNRNYTQSEYRLEYEHAGVTTSGAWLVALGVLLFARFVLLAVRPAGNGARSLYFSNR